MCPSEIVWPEEWGALAVLSGSSTGRTGLDLYVRVSYKVPLLISTQLKERIGRSP